MSGGLQYEKQVFRKLRISEFQISDRSIWLCPPVSLLNCEGFVWDLDGPKENCSYRRRWVVEMWRWIKSNITFRSFVLVWFCCKCDSDRFFNRIGFNKCEAFRQTPGCKKSRRKLRRNFFFIMDVSRYYQNYQDFDANVHLKKFSTQFSPKSMRYSIDSLFGELKHVVPEKEGLDVEMIQNTKAQIVTCTGSE